MKQPYRQRTPLARNRALIDNATATVNKYRTLNPVYEEHHQKARTAIEQNLSAHNNDLFETVEWLLDRYVPDHETRTLFIGTAGIINHEKQTP